LRGGTTKQSSSDKIAASDGRRTRNDVGRVIFAGNIGKGVLDSVEFISENTLLVLELSSFQLEAFEQHKVSPKYSVITNILRDHLNYYASMKDYIQAKRAIAEYQNESDFLFLRKDDPLASSKKFLNGLKGEVVYFSEDDLPKDFQPTLPGEHNKLNYAAALKVVTQLGIESQKALNAMNQFEGVEFREQLIKEWSGIKIYNDTAATTPDAAIAALKTFPDCVLIAGGMNKNLEFDQFAKAIDTYAKAVYFLEGDATEQIKDLLRAVTKRCQKNSQIRRYHYVFSRSNFI